MGDKSIVRLRQKPTKGGGASLYLDIYVAGRRSYEFLRLYLAPERTREDRRKNKETLALAESVRAQRLADINDGRFGVSRVRRDVTLAEYVEAWDGERNVSAATHCIVRSCLAHLRVYGGGGTMLRAVDARWLVGWRKYLLGARTIRHADGRDVCRSSAATYYAVLALCLRTAFRRGDIPADPTAGVDGIERQERERTYLTTEEVRRLVATPCRNGEVRRAFLFACFTGLRYSDVSALRWRDVRREGGAVRIVYRQRKTGGQEYCYLTPQAVEILGERGADDAAVFALPSDVYSNMLLARWAAAAGITRHVTFHASRHTFAVLMLEAGADLYTVSRLLGHRDVRTTEVYAHIVDERKREAVNRMPDLLH